MSWSKMPELLDRRIMRKQAAVSRSLANYLGHFLFTNLILDRIIAAHGIIINITSMAYTLAEIDTKNINFDVMFLSPLLLDAEHTNVMNACIGWQVVKWLVRIRSI